MKTLAELNQKWYWRLGKIVFILFAIFCLIFSVAIPIEYIETNRTYHPDTINKKIQEIKNFEERKTKTINELEKNFPKNNYTPEEIVEIFKKKDIENEQKLTTIHLLTAVGKKISNVEICATPNCGTEEHEMNEIFSYCYDFAEFEKEVPCDIYSTAYIHQGDVELLGGFINTDYGVIIEKIKKSEHLDYSEEELLETMGISVDMGEKNHTDAKHYIIAIIIWVVTIIGIILGLYIIRGTIYFIILGKFHPQKE
ncbi:MAG: hypothetical protein ACTTH6_01870 [Candidatus Altimarinota bacterium]